MTWPTLRSLLEVEPRPEPDYAEENRGWTPRAVVCPSPALGTGEALPPVVSGT